ncbi:hypothetical protein C5C45_01280 [Rathayibacter rathayi]|uniref:Carrier domain-containing protein n=1 Tax=Rathayibacter rathayi TaxID=33887 RepID=A0ABX5AEL1_RATRA|nr:hypothetical protein C5C08_06385 [Rathayibacter rathayi]PPH37811.1 hypothetical protein C5C28_03565 [Rathayibacter rathayi]PPH70806.1 hypothetical protein C5C45_01280 [Rathayibacter rathayi]PPH78116.1 hypothetical protein C5C40_05965 [Rathayibacter rathayi]
MDYVGRRDRQVKVGGQRIELGDVEAALTSAPGVHAAAAFVVGGTLVAVYTGRVAPEAVQSHASAVVPAALVPARLSAVAELPLTPHGKLDRAALTLLDRVPEAVGGRAPAGATEVTLSEAFATALGVSAVPADVDFFSLGGDSISAIAVVAAARRGGVPVSVVDLFETRTVEGLATRCSPAAATAGSQQRAVPLPASLVAARADGADIDAMTVSAPLGTADAAAARRALAEVVAARTELRVRLDRSRARLWRAFQVDHVPPGDGVSAAEGRLAAVETADDATQLIVHRMALPADAEQGLRRLVAEIGDAILAGEETL